MSGYFGPCQRRVPGTEGRRSEPQGVVNCIARCNPAAWVPASACGLALTHRGGVNQTGVPARAAHAAAVGHLVRAFGEASRQPPGPRERRRVRGTGVTTSLPALQKDEVLPRVPRRRPTSPAPRPSHHIYGNLTRECNPSRGTSTKDCVNDHPCPLVRRCPAAPAVADGGRARSVSPRALARVRSKARRHSCPAHHVVQRL
jgi:hypothetical protein